MGKLAQSMVHGANIVTVEGNFDDALRLVREAAESGAPVAVVNSINPFRLEGQKTAAFEIIEDLGDAPDAHFLPVGNAGNISAYWKGYGEFHALGRSTRLPRMIGFQAAGAAPLFHGRVVENPETLASAIRIGNPASWKLATQAISSPASVVVTLRVVRCSRRRPSRSSSRRTASLSPEALCPVARAASRKPPARATATKASRSARPTRIGLPWRCLVRLKGLAPSGRGGIRDRISTGTRRSPSRTARADRPRLSRAGARARSSWSQELPMSPIERSGTFALGSRGVHRLGYGAMQLAGPGVFGPPKDPEAALAVLRAAVESGVDHIDTSDFYGPHVTNRLIREALHPYADYLVIVTKVGCRRGDDKSWNRADSVAELGEQVHGNLRNLGLDAVDVVNYRCMIDPHHPAEGSIAAPVAALAELKRNGLIRHVGLSHVTPAQVAEARGICEIACVQNLYNLAHRGDDALIDDLARDGIAYVPYFPLGGFTPLQSSTLSAVAARLEHTPLQVALAWLIRRSPNILLIPGTSSLAHLRENIAAGGCTLPDDAAAELDGIAARGAA